MSEEESQKSPILISEIHLQNLLSFGPDAKPIPLGPLNVLIGANGSGKSNLIDVINLLRSIPIDLQDAIRKGGGFGAWVHKAQNTSSGNPDFGPAFIKIRMPSGSNPDLCHFFTLLRHNGSYVVGQESINPISDPEIPRILYVDRIHPNSAPRQRDFGTVAERYNPPGLKPDQSILSQLHNPDLRNFLFEQIGLGKYKEEELFKAAFDLSEMYKKIRIYREFHFGRSSAIRQPFPKDFQDDFLEEDCSNLALFLNRILSDPTTKEKYLFHLRNIYDGVNDIKILDLRQWVEIVLVEGDVEISAVRLSDGTLRYMCLLAILLDPIPAPLLCIEEPELGIHPQLIVKIADLLIEASQRTQLIITTHSEMLVNVLSEHPESVLTVEKVGGKTEVERLGREWLDLWLDQYRLGEIWSKGLIGGNRW